MSNQFGQPQQDPSATQSNLVRALSGNYAFDLKNLFKRGNGLVKQHLWVLLPASVLLVVFVVLLAVAMVSSLNITDVEQLPQTTQAFMDVIVILLIAPLVTGLMMMGVSCARRESVTTLDMFRYLPLILPLALAQFVISVLTQLGLALLIVPGLYVFMGSVFTLPLIADKRLSVTQALLLSFKVFNKYLAQFIAVFAVFLLLFTLAALTFGVALVWVVPLYYTTLGTLYDDLFGHSTLAHGSVSAGNESHFDA